MNKAEIIDESGNKVVVDGIYYVSNNNYYFIYTKGEVDESGHIVLYILKILQEVNNTPNGPVPTGFLVGVKVTDENEYNLVKQDITNIVAEKQNNTEPKVMYLDISMLQNLKVKDSRTFKLDAGLYNRIFKNNDVVEQNVVDNSINQNVDNNIVNELSQVNETTDMIESNENIKEPLVEQDSNNYKEMYEEEVMKNEQLQNEINNLNNIINQIKSIIQ